MDSPDVKWVVLRGFFGCGSNVLTVCAVLAGAHVGSVGALSSVNTVVAALLGRLVLGEALGKLHVLAILLAVAGAVLISDPETMGGAESKILGNALALLAGICLGCMFISSRKSGKASAQILTSSAMAWRWLVCWVLAFCPQVPNGHFENLLTSPFQSVSRALLHATSLSAQVLCFFLLLVILWVCNLLSSMGAKKCPAALSSTVMTGVQMASGYLVDIVCALHEGLSWLGPCS